MEDAQKEIQRIYEEVISPELSYQSDEKIVSIHMSQEDFRKVCSFFDMFAYS